MVKLWVYRCVIHGFGCIMHHSDGKFEYFSIFALAYVAECLVCWEVNVINWSGMLCYRVYTVAFHHCLLAV